MTTVATSIWALQIACKLIFSVKFAISLIRNGAPLPQAPIIPRILCVCIAPTALGRDCLSACLATCLAAIERTGQTRRHRMDGRRGRHLYLKCEYTVTHALTQTDVCLSGYWTLKWIRTPHTHLRYLLAAVCTILLKKFRI